MIVQNLLRSKTMKILSCGITAWIPRPLTMVFKTFDLHSSYVITVNTQKGLESQENNWPDILNIHIYHITILFHQFYNYLSVEIPSIVDWIRGHSYYTKYFLMCMWLGLYQMEPLVLYKTHWIYYWLFDLLVVFWCVDLLTDWQTE